MAKFVGRYVYFVWPSGNRNPVFKSIIKVQSVGTTGSHRSIGKFELIWFKNFEPISRRSPRSEVSFRLKGYVFVDHRFWNEQELIKNIFDGIVFNG